MSIPQRVAEVLRGHVTLEVESLDRMYLNVYVPRLQYAGGVASFFRYHRGFKIASSVLMQPISRKFVTEMEVFTREYEIPVVAFQKGERKDDIAAEYRASFEGQEGVLFLGKAQEKTPVFRTEKRLNPNTGQRYPWIVQSTAMVNQYYWYCLDEDFGPFFLKFCSYFPYNAKLCLNGHEYVKRQLEKEGIGYEALDNGILSCEDPQRLQALCDDLSADRIRDLLRKWLAFLPHPFTQEDKAAGYQYDVSILQAEFSLTQVLDRPLAGRCLFESLIRENLDQGRPSQVQLIFNRRVTKRTPGSFRTRVITQGVVPSLHVDYKHSKVKQYHKEGRALRTETTINDPRDFGIGKRLQNLPALREVGFQTNRRLLDVERISHDCTIGEEAFHRVQQPIVVQGQRASALRFGELRVQALFHALLLFSHLPQGFANRDLRAPLAQLLGLAPSLMTPGRMTYELRRLSLHGLIHRIPGTQRYRITEEGLPIVLFFARTYAHLLRPGLSQILTASPPPAPKLRTAFDNFERALAQHCQAAKLGR
jgi:hypothetical protein